MTEAQLETSIRDTAHQLGWLEYHTRDSRGSTPGFPDLVMVRNGILLFAENKSAKGKASDDQIEWLERLSQADPDGGRVLVSLFRPEDWDSYRIVSILANAGVFPAAREAWWDAYLETSWFHNRRKPYFPEEG